MRLLTPRVALSLAGLVLLAGGLGACGGDDSSSTASDAASSTSSPTASASPSEAVTTPGSAESDAAPATAASADPDVQPLCDVYVSFVGQVATITDKNAVVGGVVRQFGKALAGVTPPASMPADAKAGLAVTITEAGKTKADATAADLQKSGSTLTADQEKQAEALAQYVGESCPQLASAGQGSASGQGTATQGAVPTTSPS